MANNVEMLVNVLSESGYRVTQPRRAVIEALCRARRSLDPETICTRARSLHPAVGLATVYRTLDMLQALGHCSRVQIGSKGYALTCGERKMHVHLVCSHCMGVTEMEADDAMASLKHKLDGAGFKAQANSQMGFTYAR